MQTVFDEQTLQLDGHAEHAPDFNKKPRLQVEHNTVELTLKHETQLDKLHTEHALLFK